MLERLSSGRLVGTFVKLPALESIDICAAALDFCVVDHEHSQLSESEVLSSVRRVDEVDALRRAANSAPGGTRSISLAHPAAKYGAIPLRDYVAGVTPPLLVIQIETRETDDSLAEICGAGVDVVFLGLTDLLVDCELDEDAARARADEIASAASDAGVVLGGFGAEERFRYSVVSSDVALLREAVAAAR